mmetsp:Transcript_20568/g.27923  ORF Transcript_20568/g.27923 Transcript_20568/m.27923 type:complete len:119 (+) Transcript_20568:39-395(+)
MQNKEKLILCLDLDNTVVHCSRNTQDTPKPALRRSGLHSILHQGQERFLKIRPHVGEFLNRANNLYNIYIYTQGTTSYAKQVSDILDPEHRIFCGVYAREDSCQEPKKKITAKIFQRF